MTSRRFVTAVAALTCVALSLLGPSASAAPSGRPSGDVSAPSPGSGQANRLAAALRNGFGTRVGGAVASLSVPGRRPWVGAVGESDIRRHTPMTADLQSPIGSISKTFTGMLVMQEVERGSISLDDRLSTWYPWIAKSDEITVAMLLNMSSGIGDYLNDRIGEFAAEMLTDPSHRYDPEDLIAIGAALPRAFETPGTQYAYSNTNTTILGRILERVTGRTFARLTRERLLVPLGLTRTRLNFQGRMQAPHVQTYSAKLVDDGEPPVVTTDWSSSWAYAAGALVSTVDDLRRWGRVLGTGEGVIGPRTQRTRFARCVPAMTLESGDRVEYCLGVVAVRGARSGRITSIWHNGEVLGAVAYVGYFPATGAVLAVLSNTDQAVDGTNAAMQIAQGIQTAVPGLLTR